jgi:hypothetical protein
MARMLRAAYRRVSENGSKPRAARPAVRPARPCVSARRMACHASDRAGPSGASLLRGRWHVTRGSVSEADANAHPTRERISA